MFVNYIFLWDIVLFFGYPIKAKKFVYKTIAVLPDLYNLCLFRKTMSLKNL